MIKTMLKETITKENWNGEAIQAYFHNIGSEEEVKGLLVGFGAHSFAYCKADDSKELVIYDECYIYHQGTLYEEDKFYSASLKSIAPATGIFMYHQGNFQLICWTYRAVGYPAQHIYEEADLDSIEEYAPVYATYEELLRWLSHSEGLVKNRSGQVGISFFEDESNLYTQIEPGTLKVKRFGMFARNEAWVEPIKEYINGEVQYEGF